MVRRWVAESWRNFRVLVAHKHRWQVLGINLRQALLKLRMFVLKLRMRQVERRMRRCEVLMFGEQGRNALVQSGKLSLGIAQLRAVCNEGVDSLDKFKDRHKELLSVVTSKGVCNDA